ncbi:TPA: phage portal protein [Salmonella enterica]|nr:phage portal protein [Salmonella enterica]
MLCAGAYWCYSRGYQKADSSWKFQWAQRDLTDATAALQQEVTERAKEQRRQHAADEERKRADEELAKIQADADAAERARGGLQQQLAAVQRQLAGSETGRLSALAAASQAKAETGIPRFLPSGRPAMLHIFEPVEDGQTRGANQFYSVMERLKMLDTLQATQLQSAIVKAMYAATIESELDSEKAFEYITAADNKDTPLVNMLANYARYYSTNSIKLGGVKIPHLYPGDELNLQTAQDSDNGFSALEQALLRYIAAGLGVSYEQLSRDYSQVSYSSARASANESWRYFLGRRRFIAGRLATQMFSCWLEEALIRGVIRAPRARFSFWEARSSWSRSEWIGAGRMAIDGLKEVQESVMRIEAGLSTYEKELAIMGEDYQEIFRQQVRESEERRAAGLSRPVWISGPFRLTRNRYDYVALNFAGGRGFPVRFILHCCRCR